MSQDFQSQKQNKKSEPFSILDIFKMSNLRNPKKVLKKGFEKSDL
jgi:hypothetical protein